MQVLVSTATKHGATAGIGHAVATSLRTSGLSVVELGLDQVDGLDGFDAVVLGSAVYAGHWRREARDFVHDHADELRRVPVWLFSSGPIGEPPVPVEDSPDGREIAESIEARDHRTFGGKLDRRNLSFGERTVARAVRTRDGDFRDWDEIARWAEGIAHELSAVPA